MSEHLLTTMTQLHFDLMMDLFKMCTSHYTQVYHSIKCTSIVCVDKHSILVSIFMNSCSQLCITPIDQDQSSTLPVQLCGLLLVLMQDIDASCYPSTS